MESLSRLLSQRWSKAAIGVGSLALLAYLVVPAGCGPDTDAFNCALYDTTGWRAPDGCVCTGPEGEPTWLGADGKEHAIRCEDTRLVACPSTSGAGCGLIGMPQWPLEGAPAEVLLHVDIGGHLHDLCCAQHYYLPGGTSDDTTCNGCTAITADNFNSCLSMSIGGAADLVFGKPFDPSFPCAVEWRYATTAFTTGPYAWWVPFDTSLRWTPAQAVSRNMAGVGGTYARPDGKGMEGVPLYGRALAPTEDDPVDRRAMTGTIVGDARLSRPFDDLGDSLGLSPAQIGSFCQSEKALFVEELQSWVCQ
jgi:hypothetical protein